MVCSHNNAMSFMRPGKLRSAASPGSLGIVAATEVIAAFAPA